MKLYVVVNGTRVALGNGDGSLVVTRTAKQFDFMQTECDPIYYYNSRNNPQIKDELDKDPTIKEKSDVVAKFELDDGDVAIVGYKFMYVNYNDIDVMC